MCSSRQRLVRVEYPIGYWIAASPLLGIHLMLKRVTRIPADFDTSLKTFSYRISHNINSAHMRRYTYLSIAHTLSFVLITRDLKAFRHQVVTIPLSNGKHQVLVVSRHPVLVDEGSSLLAATKNVDLSDPTISVTSMDCIWHKFGCRCWLHDFSEMVLGAARFHDPSGCRARSY